VLLDSEEFTKPRSEVGLCSGHEFP
jgi:hypothetical protein